jgi:hypothetical protein
LGAGNGSQSHTHAFTLLKRRIVATWPQFFSNIGIKLAAAFSFTIMIDNLIYTDKREVPEIDKTLIEFLEKHLSNEFPDILKGNRDELLVHQGKLEVVKALKFLYDEQNRRDDSF